MAMTSISDVLPEGDPSMSLGQILGFVEGIIKFALDFAGILAVIMILYSAFRYVTAFGEESKAESAKKTLLWAIIGLAVISLSAIIKNLVQKELS